VRFSLSVICPRHALRFAICYLRSMVNGCHSLALRSSGIRSIIRYRYAQTGEFQQGWRLPATRKLAAITTSFWSGYTSSRGRSATDPRGPSDSKLTVPEILNPLPSIFFSISNPLRGRNSELAQHSTLQYSITSRGRIRGRGRERSAL
jgi:hypothetical protein